MALPAGRYGVTKNQLLKIKKLPMNTIKLIEELTEKFDLLGTAAFKNSTSVVTESTDLVESGAVYDAIESAYQLVKNTVGYTGKNLWTYPYGCLQGYINSDGSITTSSGGYYTDYLSVNTSQIYMEYGARGGSAGCRIACYDKDKTFISRILKTANNSVFDLPINTKYIRVCCDVGASDYFTDLIVCDNHLIDKSYESGNLSVEDKKCDNSVIGTVEDGTNPTKAYAVGEHFIRDGKFCTVTVAVTTSSTWTLGSNYVEGTIADNLVKQDTFNVTTSANGNAIITSDSTKNVLKVKTIGAVSAMLYNTENGTEAHFVNIPSLTSLASTEVSGTYYYI